MNPGIYTYYKNLLPMSIFFWVVMTILGCDEKNREIEPGDYATVQEIPAPRGFEREVAESNTFTYYLRSLELKEDKTVLLYNGLEKDNQDAQYAVVKMDVGKKDLQQCADAVIRLRAEYLYSNQLYDKIHFKFTNGEKAEYTAYANGSRPVVIHNSVRWSKNTAQKDFGYKVFRKYLDMVFTYAGTLSLNGELHKIALHELQPGDVFIQTGYPYGHAVIVVDVALNKTTGRKAFMLAQSYMPAQEIHILKNPEKNNDPWFYDDFGSELVTPEWTFKAIDLKRFGR
ncbi:MAG TPA: DUF4846 domain-containing protein [Bacteroidia bacterium]|nr:DUF4846 domain-containing protein [Bacteroidia bacterium]